MEDVRQAKSTHRQLRQCDIQELAPHTSMALIVSIIIRQTKLKSDPFLSGDGSVLVLARHRSSSMGRKQTHVEHVPRVQAMHQQRRVLTPRVRRVVCWHPSSSHVNHESHKHNGSHQMGPHVDGLIVDLEQAAVCTHPYELGFSGATIKGCPTCKNIVTNSMKPGSRHG